MPLKYPFVRIMWNFEVPGALDFYNSKKINNSYLSGKLIDEFDDTKKQEAGKEDATLLMAR